MVDHRYLFKISVVSECIVKRIGDLPFDFNIGSCGTFIVDSLVTILLCFSASNDRRGCRSLTRRNNDPLSSIEDFAFDAEFEVDRYNTRSLDVIDGKLSRISLGFREDNTNDINFFRIF